MRLTQFDMKMIFYMDNYETISLEAMSEYLGISEKTLKNRLNDLQYLLEQYNIQLDFLNGNQIKIYGQKYFIYLIRENSIKYEMEFEKKFLLLLALHSDYIIIQDIADKLFVSKSYAEKKISTLLQKYKQEIQSQRHYGICYKATFQQRIQRIVSILFPYMVGNDFKVAFRQFHELHFPILNYFTEQELDKAVKAINDIAEMKWMEFTDESIQQLYVYMLCTIHFCKNDTIFCNKNELLTMKNQKAPIFHWIFNFLKNLDIPITNEIVNNLYFLFLTLRNQKVTFQEQIEQKISCCIEYVLKEIQNHLSINMSEDRQLYQELALHIYTTVMRENVLKMETDFDTIRELKRQYPLGFEMAVITADYVADMYALSISENNLIYLTLHYQAAIERIKDTRQKAKVIVVCHFGMAGANVIRSKIERCLSDSIEVIKTCSFQEFLNGEEMNCDFIITTERILHTNKPVIYVTLTFPEKEIKHIEEYVQNMQIKNMLKVQLMKAPIIHIKKETKYFDAIREMTVLLEKNDDVAAGYIDSVLEREKISATNLFYIAMPHGAPSLVKQTRLVIARMDKAIQWNDTKVICAFLFAATTDMLKENPLVFSLFYKALSDPDIEEKIRNLQTKEFLSDDIFRKKLIKILC